MMFWSFSFLIGGGGGFVELLMVMLELEEVMPPFLSATFGFELSGLVPTHRTERYEGGLE